MLSTTRRGWMGAGYLVARRLDPFTRTDRLYAEDFDLYNRLLAHGRIARLDTRIEGRTRQYDSYGDADGGYTRYGTALATGSDLNHPMISGSQFRWLQDGLTQSTAVWQLLGNQDIMARMWIPASVLQLQSAALDRLMSPGTATRLLDLPLYVSEKERKGLISLNEVYGTLQGAVWSELKQGGGIDRLRRNLQREHARRVFH